MGSAPRGQSWGLGSATACWQGQGNTISPWEQALHPPLPLLGGVRSWEHVRPGSGHSAAPRKP